MQEVPRYFLHLFLFCIIMVTLFMKIGVFMKELLKGGRKLFFKIVFVNILCFFLVISFNVITTAVFSEKIGYTAYGTTSDSNELTELYTHYYDDGEDTKKAAYEEAGYKVTTDTISTELSKSGKICFLVISQVFAAILTCGLIYPEVWHNATGDSNLVKFKHKKKDKLKGVKIGLIAVIPNYLFLIFLVIAKLGAFPSFPMALYKLLNSSVYSVIDVILGGAASVSELAAWRLALLFIPPLLIPVLSGISYILGFKNISIGEKLIYKKNSSRGVK